VDRCPDCGGLLVNPSALESIKRTTIQTEADLRQESATFAASAIQPLRCPSCVVPMRKETTSAPPVVEVDRCPSCKAVWLDPGELAMIQLAHEASAQGRDAESLKQRYRQLEASPERRRRFEQNVASLPEEPGTGPDVLAESVGEAAAELLRVLATR
jgi:Zn-finger nucleic acid-binding protein